MGCCWSCGCYLKDKDCAGKVSEIRTDFRNTCADLEPKVCLITGAYTGLGYETALGLAKKGMRVIIGKENYWFNSI